MTAIHIPQPPAASARLATFRRVQVPLEPPSLNHYKLPSSRGGFYLSKAARAFKEAVCLIARQQPRTEWTHYAVMIDYVLKSTTRLDIDNAAKLVLDGLQASGLISNDANVLELVQRKRRTRDPFGVVTDICICEMPEAAQWK